MTEIPETVDLRWIARRLVALQDDVRSLRSDVDMLVRLTVRTDTTANALREDVKTLWLSQGDLRQRIEAVEGR
jgi:hypothetical protein